MSDPSNYDRRGASQASQIVWMEKRIAELEAESSNLRTTLKKYGEHFRSCPAYSNMTNEPCLCGLAAELKGE